LRAVAQTVMGPVTDSHYNNLGDAKWNEKLAAVVLLVGIVAIGIAPFWLNKLVTPVADSIIEQTSRTITIK